MPTPFDKLPVFVDMVSMTILPEDQFPELLMVDQRLYFDGQTMWNRVTPGLLRWMEHCVATQKAKENSVERSEEFLMRITFESGVEAGGDPVPAVMKGPPLIPNYRF